MKRNVLTSILLAAVFAALVFGVIFLNEPELFLPKRQEEQKDEAIDEGELTLFSVNFGPVEYSRSVKGSVISGMPKKYEKKLTLKNAVKEKTKLNTELMHDFNAGDVIAVCGERELKAEFDGRLVACEFDGEAKTAVLTVLDYGELDAELWVSKEIADTLDYSSTVRIEYDGHTCMGVITYIGYELTNGAVRITVHPSDHLMPGQEIECVFVIGERDECMYLPEQFVFFDLDGTAYTTDYDGQSKSLFRVPLTVGEHFIRYDPGSDVPYGYWEVLSGVEPGQTLCVLGKDGVEKDIAGLIANE